MYWFFSQINPGPGQLIMIWRYGFEWFSDPVLIQLFNIKPYLVTYIVSILYFQYLKNLLALSTWESTKYPTTTPISSNPDVWTAASCRVSGANIKVIVIWWGGLDGGVLSLYVRRSSFSEALQGWRESVAVPATKVYLNNASGRCLHEAR